MVNYTCEKCNVNFLKKYSYLRHINKKFDCSKKSNLIPSPFVLIPEMPKNNNIYINNDNDNINNKLCCNYCNKFFYSKSNLTKHLNNNNCKVKKLQDEEKENIFKILLAKDEEMKKKDEENKKNMNKLEENNKELQDYVKKLTDMNKNLQKNYKKTFI
jgi:hypothetical protein